jgi:hypothetical protein
VPTNLRAVVVGTAHPTGPLQPLLLVGLVLAISGCGDDKPASPDGKKTTGTQSASARPTESPCEGTLATIDEVFKLSKLGRTTTISDGVLRLNDWQRTCAPSGLSADLPPEIEKLLSESQLNYLAEKRFSLRDGEHLRDCLLDRAVSIYGVGTGATEIERVTHLFGHVVRAIGLVPAPPQNLPLTPYEVYLLGKGTAEDRAWVFINILKQLRIDAALIVPPYGGNEQPGASADSPFLVGVLLDDQIYLFDPRAGMPIPALAGGSGSGTIPQAATLPQAASDPAVLKQLDTSGKPYPITAESLKQPDVLLVADAAFWSARMQGLQTQFVGARAMVIADPLGDAGDDALGAVSRIAKASAGFWDTGRLHVWDFPEKRMVAHAQMSDDQQEILGGLLTPFGAYLNVVIDRNGQPMLVGEEKHEDRAGDPKYHPGVSVISRTTTGAQMRARLKHLEGDLPQAIREYFEVRDKCREVLRFKVSVPDQIRHKRALEDATFWTALCQYEQGEFKAAINTLAFFRKRPEMTNWQREKRYLLAMSQAAEGDYPAAIAELKTAQPDDLEYAGYQYLIRHWQSAGKAEAN